MADALERLAKLRADAVDRARRAAHAARTEEEACRRACEGARIAEQHAAHALSEARVAFAAARSVEELRWSARVVEVARANRASAAARLAHQERRVRRASAEVRMLTERLATCERDRRAVARALERREREVMRRTERALEDDADDLFRARARAKDHA